MIFMNRSTRTSLAPVLSATRHRDSCWIIASSSSSLGLLHDLDHPPPLGLRKGPRLHDPNGVPHPGAEGVVVGLEPGGPPDDLAVQRMTDLAGDPHDHGLLHGVGDDH